MSIRRFLASKLRLSLAIAGVISVSAFVGHSMFRPIRLSDQDGNIPPSSQLEHISMESDELAALSTDTGVNAKIDAEAILPTILTTGVTNNQILNPAHNTKINALAFHPAGISEIEIFIDNKLTAHCIEPKDNICSVFIKGSNTPLGIHTMRVEALAANAASSTSILTFTLDHSISNSDHAHISWGTGTLTSSTAMVPYNENNPSTCSIATGTSNHNLLKGLINSKVQIDVDNTYCLDSTSGTLTLVTGDSIRLRGVGNNHKFIISPDSTRTTTLFSVPRGVSIYLSGVDFKFSAGLSRVIFSYVMNERCPASAWPATARSISCLVPPSHTNEVIIRDSSFEGGARLLYVDAQPRPFNLAMESGTTTPVCEQEEAQGLVPQACAKEQALIDQAQTARMNPSTISFGKIAIHNNKLTDVLVSSVMSIDGPWVREFRVTDNTIRNSGWVITSFRNDNVGNTCYYSSLGEPQGTSDACSAGKDGTREHHNPSRDSDFIIDGNTYINDDSFDIFASWYNDRRPSGWTSNRSTWRYSGEYHTPIVHKGSENVEFTNNHIEGMHTHDAGSSPNIYNAYLSGRKVLYENNTIINNVAFVPDATQIGEVVLVKAKSVYGPLEGTARIIRNNTFTVTDDYAQRILGAKYSTTPAQDLLNATTFMPTHMTSSVQTFIFENNKVNIPALGLYANSEYSYQNSLYLNNKITANYIRQSYETANGMHGSFLAFGSSFRPPETMNHLSRAMIGNTINIKYENNIDSEAYRKAIALVAGTSYIPSTVTIKNNKLDLANLRTIYSYSRSTGGSGGTATEIPNMTLNFDRNTVTNKPAGPITKAIVPSSYQAPIFSSFNNNIGDFTGKD